MNEIPNFELFYDVLEESIRKLFEIKHDRYFNLLTKTCHNILANEVLIECKPEDKKELEAIYKKLDGIDFNVEEIRKAYQMIVLRGFNEENIKNGSTTPDTLGIFIAYLVNKLMGKKEELNILDPVCGTGNLLYSVANNLEANLHLFGVDNIKEVIQISNDLGDMLGYDIEMFCQDTLSTPFNDIDVVVCDIDGYTDENYNNRYFPYLCVIEHLASLKKDGYMFTIVPNDFFEHDEDGFFKEHLKELGTVEGILQLPTNMFKNEPKSIIIFSRAMISKGADKCLLIELPSFKDEEKFNQALIRIEMWFNERVRKEV